MKIKKLLVTSSFIILAATTTFTITDATSKEITKIVIEDNQNNTPSSLSIIAHRGFSSLEIENSKEAIELGLSESYTNGVEIDIHLTKDDQVIVSHNSKINDKKISENDLTTLQQEKIKNDSFANLTLYLNSLLDSKSGNLIRERIKILNDKETEILGLNTALDIHDNYPDKNLIIEIKYDERDKKHFSDIIYDILKKHNQSNIIIQSYDYEALINMKNKYPNIEYHLIIKKDNYDRINLQDLDGYVIRKNLINYDDIQTLLTSNKKVSVWTINTYQEYQDINNTLKDLTTQVYFITDYPDALRTYHNLQNQSPNKQKIKK